MIESFGVRAVSEQDGPKGLRMGIERLLRHKYGDLILLFSVMFTFGVLVALSASSA